MKECDKNEKTKAGRKGFMRFLTDRDGAMAVEFAMISMAFLTTVFGTIESGRALWAQSALQSALDDTSRYALTHRDASDSTLQSYAQARMADIYADNSGFTVMVNRTTTDGVDFITFDGSYAFKTLIPFLPTDWSSMDLTGESKTPIPAVAYAPPSSSGTSSGTSGSGSGTGTSGTSGTSSSGTDADGDNDGTAEETCAHGHSCQCQGNDH